jgi:DNA polymerase-3 subunit delta'
MSWNYIINQEKVKKILQNAFIEKRIGHSYIFYGEDGVGKEAVAIEFAKLCNCERPIIEGLNANSCGKCSQCMQFDTFITPSLLFIHPSNATEGNNGELNFKDDEIKHFTKEFQEKSKNYYHKIDYNNAQSIKVASIRDIKKKLMLSGSGFNRRFVIILDAEKMLTEAANAFLKTLEEPQDNITIICVTSRIEQLLSTIKSRCQLIKFSNLENTEIQNYLVRHYNLNQENANMLANLSDGSITRALNFIDEDYNTFREKTIDLMRLILKPKNYKIDLIKLVEETAKLNKKQIGLFLDLILFWLIDSYKVFQSKGNKVSLKFADKHDTLKLFAERYNLTEIDNLTSEVEKSRLRIKRNVDVKVALLPLFLNIREILRS